MVRGSDNFFEIGGHSLAATRVASRINRALGVKVPIRLFFESMTLDRIASWIESAMVVQLKEMSEAHAANLAAAVGRTRPPSLSRANVRYPATLPSDVGDDTRCCRVLASRASTSARRESDDFRQCRCDFGPTEYL
jgi:hypothetical protein